MANQTPSIQSATELPQEPSRSPERARWLVDLPRFGIIILSALYSVGLIIINIDLGRYGLVSLNLARPEYILAGVLCLFLSITTIGAWQVISELIRASFSQVKPISLKSLLQLAWLVVLLFGIIAILDTLLGTLSLRRIALLHGFNFASLWTTIAILTNAAILHSTFTTIKNLLEKEELVPKALFYGTYRGFSPVTAISLLLGAIATYSWFAYPHFSRAFGGGNKPVVKLLVSPSSSFSPTNLGLPIEKKDESIGPVTLVFESDAMFFVRAIDPDEKSWGLQAATETVGIAKGLVSSLIYISK